MKYFVFSIDDGTIFDKTTIELFNKYHIKGTFNLNSGLPNFLWYYNSSIPILRFTLNNVVHLYDGHEVASHTLTHPYLDQCPDEIVIKEVNEDIRNLENIFHRKINSFATPFSTCGEREIELIKNNCLVTNIRISQIDESFRLPIDQFHIKITALEINRALELFDKFIDDKEAILFVYAGHSYDFYVNNTFHKLEELIQKITAREDISVLTMGEFVNRFYK